MTTSQSGEENQTFELARFLLAQESVFDTAVSELQQGRKESRFIFPQINGLGRSLRARRYAIRNLDEARGFLRHPVLGPRILKCCQALLSINGRSASDIMVSPDDIKLKSSMTLFSLVSDSETEFCDVLDKYFAGCRDQRTIELLNSSHWA